MHSQVRDRARDRGEFALQSFEVTHAAIRDIDIRRSLHAEIRRRHEGEVDTLFVDEMGLCQGNARVDLAVVNGSLHGYEIKSERDTLARLPGQCDAYNRALDYVTIVISTKHARGIRQLVPKWWGIWAATSSSTGLTLRQVRVPRRNPSLDAQAVAQLLWRDEALEELEARALAEGLRSKPRAHLWDRLATALPIAELCHVVRERLKRRHWRVDVPRTLGGDSSRPCAKSSRCQGLTPAEHIWRCSHHPN